MKSTAMVWLGFVIPCLGCATPLLAQDGRWDPLTVGPGPRFAQACAYDPVRQRMFVFGGSLPGSQASFPVFNDLWVLDMGDTPTWSQSPTQGTPPSPVSNACMAYDPVRDRMIVYGGTTSGGEYGPSTNDVWELSFAGQVPSWRQLAPVGPGPSMEAGSVMVYDPVRDRMIVLGHYQIDEVWSLTLSDPPAWHQLHPGGLPPSCVDATGIYDPVGDRVVVYGGVINQSPRPSALSLTGDGTWTRITPSQLTPWPDPRTGSRAVYDPLRRRMIVYGGYGFSDTWALSLGDAAAWERLSATSGDRVGYSSLCYIPGRDELVSFGGAALGSGGYDPHDLLRVFELSTSAWTISSLPHFDESLVTDTRRHRVIAFGGRDGGQILNDLWVWSGEAGDWWTQMPASHAPPQPRYHHSAAYDSVDDRMLVFGGAAPESLNDLWELRLDDPPTWNQLLPSGTPPSRRSGHSAVIDPTRHRMIVYGGASHRNGPMTLNDVWALSWSDTLRWIPLSTSGAPAPYWVGHLACYDAARDQMVAIRDVHNIATLRLESLEWAVSDTWYTPLDYDGAPGGFLDAGRERIVVGSSDYSANFTLWTYYLRTGHLVVLAPSGIAASPRLDAAMAYDAAQDRAIVFGGYRDGTNGNYLTGIDARSLGWDQASSGVRDVASMTTTIHLSIEPTISRALQWLEIRLPPAESHARVSLLDVHGRTIRGWILQGSGRVRQVWDGRDESGRRVPAGVYFACLERGSERVTHRLVRIP